MRDGIVFLVALPLGGCIIDAPTFHGPDGAVLHDASRPDAATSIGHSLFAAGDGFLRRYDLTTDEAFTRTVTTASPTELQALDDGTIVLHSAGDVVFVDARTMTELARPDLVATALGHGYVTPDRGDARYWIAFDDVANGRAHFFDVRVGSENRFEREPQGVVPLGGGRHEAAFSDQLPRIVISSADECDDVLLVADYSVLPGGVPQGLVTADAADLGFDGVSEICNVGHTPAPHGCATSSFSRHAYCSLTTLGDLAVIDVDASPPTFSMIPLSGTGGGAIKVRPGGQFVYTLQATPRNDAACVLGQLVVVDVQSDTVVAEVPLKYTGPTCAVALPSAITPRDLFFTHDGDRLFVTLEGDGDIDRVIIMDTSTERSPVQLASSLVPKVGGDAVLGGPGDRLYLVAEGPSVIALDTADLAITQSVDTDVALLLTTFGDAEGPSEQRGVIVEPFPRCSNGADDDSDGQADFPFDPDCTSPEDDDESS